MRKESDFFFGSYTAAKGQGVVSLDSLLSVADKVSETFFTSQLNRFLNLNSGRLLVSEGTSQPNFYGLIDNIKSSSIGFIEIYGRTDVNSALEATLACDLYLDQGVVTVAPHWTAYKDVRADEIVSSLLVPLHLKGLQTKSFVRYSGADPERLVEPVFCDYEEELMLVFAASRYPMVSHAVEEGRQRLKRNIRDLDAASQVGQDDLSGETAYEAFRELCKNMPIDAS